jgi:hypothetical protein
MCRQNCIVGIAGWVSVLRPNIRANFVNSGQHHCTKEVETHEKYIRRICPTDEETQLLEFDFCHRRLNEPENAPKST